VRKEQEFETMADADLAIIYIKAFVVLLVLWRVLTLGIFGQVVGGILAATLAYCLTRRSSSIPKQIKDISAPLYDLKKNPPLKLAASLILDVLSTRYIPTPAILSILVGQAGFVPIGTFLNQYLYDRPALTAIDILKAQLPFANYIPTLTLGWLIENGVIHEEWLGGSSGPFLKV
jgi:hypothetical protein